MQKCKARYKKILKYAWLICILLVGKANDIFSQNYLGGDIFIGKVLRHKDGLLFDIPPISTGVDIWYQTQTSGQKAWHRYWGKPRIEGLIKYVSFGNKDILGSAIAIAPGISFRVKQWKNSRLNFHYAPGMAYLTKEFNPITNPDNNAIGSHVNNLTRFKLSYERPISDRWSTSLSFSFSHFSNGLTSSPNSGLNVYGLNLGLKRRVKDRHIDPLAFEADEDLRYRKWGLNMMYTLGLSEWVVSGGPNYPIYNYSIGGYWRFKDFQKLHLGAEYEFSNKVYEFELAVFVEEEIARKRARRTVIYVAEEIILGDFSGRFQLGFYTPIASDYSGAPFHIKIMTLYHPPIKPLGDVKPYVAMVLKTHFAVAEYIGMAAGVSF